MPELPEVESTRRALVDALVGKKIAEVEVRRHRMTRRQEQPSDFPLRLTGRFIRGLRRHGKFLLADLSPSHRGAGDIVWVTHLGMSGRVALARIGDTEPKHTNVIVRLADGVEFRLIDPRTFGFVAAYTPEELADSPIGALGPDAFTTPPTVDALASVLAGRTAPIKALLLDQRVVAGLGNIYADETLHRARISPHRPGGSLSTAELGAIRRSIKATLEAGLRHGGTSLDDLAYLLPDGRAGEYTKRLRAYGREGQKCRRCGQVIRREVLRQRSTYWCSGCQM